MKIIFLDIDGVLNDLDYIHKVYPEKCIKPLAFYQDL